jgi:flagellar basal body-associated protein FliL
MSDAPEPEAPKPAKAPAGPKPSKALLGLIVVNLAGTGFVAFRLLTAQPAAAAVVIKEEVSESQTVTGPVTTFEPFVVNLDEPGTARYLKTTLQLELASPEVNETFEKSKQLVRDAILSYLSGLHVKDTLGAEAKDKMRTDIVARAEKILGERNVKRVFFQEFVVQ